MTYVEFHDLFRDGEWFGGHLVKKDGLFYFREWTEEGRVLKSSTYDELSDTLKNKVNRITAEKEEKQKLLEIFVNELLPARKALIDYVIKNGRMTGKSKVSESEYYSVKALDGLSYKVRISGHVYPTGSMTSMLLQTIDTTDYDCRPYLKLFGIEL